MRPTPIIVLVTAAILWGFIRAGYHEGKPIIIVVTILVSGVVLKLATNVDKAVVQRRVGRAASVELPAHLVPQYGSLSRDEWTQLQASILAALGRGSSPEDVIEDAIRTGWSRDLATWTVYLLDSNRNGVTINVSK